MLVGISVISYARNLLASHFLTRTEHTHLLFVDDDMGFNADEIARMFDWGSAEVVAAMCPKRKLDWRRIKAAVLAHPDVSPEALPNLAGDYQGMFVLPGTSATFAIGPNPVPVESIGTGIMMISRGCLETLVARANLGTVRDPAHADHPVYEFFGNPVLAGGFAGEDLFFCNLVRRHGGTVLGCPWPVVTHSGPYDFIGDLQGIAAFQ